MISRDLGSIENKEVEDTVISSITGGSNNHIKIVVKTTVPRVNRLGTGEVNLRREIDNL